jgi:hypothetical protein
VDGSSGYPSFNLDQCVEKLSIVRLKRVLHLDITSNPSRWRGWKLSGALAVISSLLLYQL